MWTSVLRTTAMRTFFVHGPPATPIYTLSLHAALPISVIPAAAAASGYRPAPWLPVHGPARRRARSEEHTSELQSRFDLVCRLLLEIKKINYSDLSLSHLTPHHAFIPQSPENSLTLFRH